MTRFFAKGTFAHVLTFALRLWLRRPGLVVILLALVLTSTAADIAIPVVTGALITAVSEAASPWGMFAILLGLGAVSIGAKVLSYFGIIALTIPTMRVAEAEALVVRTAAAAQRAARAMVKSFMVVDDDEVGNRINGCR